MTTTLTASNEVQGNNSLIPAEYLTQSSMASDQALAVVTKVGDYLPYVQLHGSSSNLVKQGKCPMGQWTVTQGKNVIVLGANFTALVLCWRPKAMRYVPEVASFYDVNSEAFKKITNESAYADSGCGFGPEYLLWLPDFADVGYASMFLGNKSGRNAAGVINQYLRNKCQFGAELVKNKKNQMWHVPKVAPIDFDITMPDFSQMKEIVDKFNTPESSEVKEKATEGGRER